MKIGFHSVPVPWRMLFVLAWVLPELPMAGLPYSLSWSTIDGGGGTSSSGIYALSGTIGQPDTAFMSGEVYQIQAGFWPGMILPPLDDIPTLTFLFIDGELWISWAPNTPGFRLEQSDDLWVGDWISAPSGNPVMIPRSAAARFYRLCKP